MDKRYILIIILVLAVTFMIGFSLGVYKAVETGTEIAAKLLHVELNEQVLNDILQRYPEVYELIKNAPIYDN